ncbi:hypothetical protein [uncultured Oscillibacter sp.]
MNKGTKSLQKTIIAILKYALLIFAAFVSLVPIVSCVITALYKCHGSA